MDTKRAMVAFGVAKNRLGLCGALALLLSSSSIAQTAFPSKPITVMVGFAPGGSLDTVARIVSKRLGDNLGQPIIVENRPGAGGSIVMNYIARTAPDGYTITLANVGSIAVNPHLLKVVYDPLVDFTPIAKAVVFPDVIVAPPQAPARTLAEFVKLAKEKSGSITYGSSGVGSAAHLAGTLLEMDADIKLVHVPYQGGAPAMRALLAGEIDSYFAAPVTVAPHIKSGKAIPIAVTGAKRMRSLPDVPTVAESGYPGYEVLNWYAYYGPAKIPADVVATLNREIVKVLHTPEIDAFFEKLGVDAAPSTPAELAAYTKREYDTWGKVVERAGIQAK